MNLYQWFIGENPEQGEKLASRLEELMSDAPDKNVLRKLKNGLSFIQESLHEGAD